MNIGHSITRTRAEEKLARALRKQRINFLQNHYLEGYEVDFWIADAGLVIEVDGFIHLCEVKIKSDRAKERRLHEKGYIVIRYNNQEINNNLNQCINEIKALITTIMIYRHRNNSVNGDWKKTLKSIKHKLQFTELKEKKMDTIETYFLSIDQETD